MCSNQIPSHALIGWQEGSKTWIMLTTGDKSHVLSEETRLRNKCEEPYAVELRPLRENDRPASHDCTAATKALMDLGWTFDEVVAVLKVEGDRND